MHVVSLGLLLCRRRHGTGRGDDSRKTQGQSNKGSRLASPAWYICGFRGARLAGALETGIHGMLSLVSMLLEHVRHASLHDAASWFWCYG